MVIVREKMDGEKCPFLLGWNVFLNVRSCMKAPTAFIQLSLFETFFCLGKYAGAETSQGKYIHLDSLDM